MISRNGALLTFIISSIMVWLACKIILTPRRGLECIPVMEEASEASFWLIRRVSCQGVARYHNHYDEDVLGMKM